jgi:protein-L-isoaspartate(D-aspartate) O-methyltransferase
VVYRPQTEIQSHYFHASLPRQFDEYIWIDETRAVRPVTVGDGLAPAHPFAG